MPFPTVNEKTRVAPKPIKWATLSVREKRAILACANRIVRRLAPHLSHRYGDNIVSLGVGFRTKGKLKRTHRELVIRIFVRKKWRKSAKRTSDSHLPRYFSAVLKGSSDKRVRVHIPTDVNQLGKGRLHRTTVKVAGNSGSVTGSICCVVEDRDTSERFLLSCNHVFGLVGKTLNCQGEITTQIDTIDPDYSAIAGIVRQGDVAPLYPDQSQFSLDAAIAKIRDATSFNRRTDGYPLQGVRRNTSAIQPGDVYKIPAKSGVLTATVIGLIRNHPIVVECGGTTHVWKFERVIEYDLASPSIPGDSGSPLIDGGVLIGMHFYYTDSEGRGFAMFAGDLFDRSVFGRNIDLVPD